MKDCRKIVGIKGFSGNCSCDYYMVLKPLNNEWERYGKRYSGRGIVELIGSEPDRFVFGEGVLDGINEVIEEELLKKEAYLSNAKNHKNF